MFLPPSIDAFSFAVPRHDGQKYGEEEYHVHLSEVVKVLRDFGFTSETWVARGWLHDVLEDTETSLAELRRKFGDDVAWPVFAVSGFGKRRADRNADIKNKLSIYGEDAQILKVADRIANCERGAKNDMYRREYKDFYLATHLAPEAMHLRLEKALYPTKETVNV